MAEAEQRDEGKLCRLLSDNVICLHFLPLDISFLNKIKYPIGKYINAILFFFHRKTKCKKELAVQPSINIWYGYKYDKNENSNHINFFKYRTLKKNGGTILK